ncbi:MAG: hypothetical protein U9N09_06120 [Euryarchaeota archaeon]|nr:hypothetical protein [Euryarchaeota archaeon]
MHRKTRIALICGILLVSLMTCGCLRDFEESRLRVTDIDILPERVTSTSVLLNVTTYIENNGNGESGEAKLILKAFDSASGLLVGETTITAGSIDKDKTIPVSQRISVEREGGYRIDVVLFEDDERLRQRSVQISGIGDLTPNVHDIGIKIQEMDFLVENVTGSRVAIGVDIYLTNEGDFTSEDLPMLVKAREVDAGLLADKVWTSTGNIEKEKTIINGCNISVPDNYNYIVETLIWRNDTIVERGEGVVQLNPKRTIPEDEEIVSSDIRVRDFMPAPTPTPVERGELMEYEYTGGAPKKTPGFTSAMTGIAVMIAIFMLIRIRRNDNND